MPREGLTENTTAEQKPEAHEGESQANPSEGRSKQSKDAAPEKGAHTTHSTKSKETREAEAQQRTERGVRNRLS